MSRFQIFLDPLELAFVNALAGYGLLINTNKREYPYNPIYKLRNKGQYESAWSIIKDLDKDSLREIINKRLGSVGGVPTWVSVGARFIPVPGVGLVLSLIDISLTIANKLKKEKVHLRKGDLIVCFEKVEKKGGKYMYRRDFCVYDRFRKGQNKCTWQIMGLEEEIKFEEPW